MTRAGHRKRRFRGFAGDEHGAAAAEFALWATVLIPILASATDFGLYVYTRMQVKQAAQVAAQTAWQTCSAAINPAYVPAVENCSGLLAKLTTAVQSTSLGTAVTLSASTEGYYCVDDTGALQQVVTPVAIPASGTASLDPGSITTCSSVGTAFTGNTVGPGDYVKVTVAYTYTPLFGAASIVSLLPTAITETAWMRLV